jgi:hypothetical protein
VTNDQAYDKVSGNKDWWEMLTIVEFPRSNTVGTGHSGRAVWGVGLGRLVAGIVGSNPAQGMDVCQRLSVLCCPV